MSEEPKKRTCYIVVFEVATASTKAAIKELLKGYSAQCAITDNCWAIVSDQTAPEVRDHLTTPIKPGDRLYVFRSGTAGAWRNAISEKHNDWLKKYL